MRFTSHHAALLGVSVLFALSANAVPTSVVSVDTATCDTLSVPGTVDELGPASVFPAGEQIGAVIQPNTPLAQCAATNVPARTSSTVMITNLQAFSFVEVWYVANPGTTLTNIDGTVNGASAFKIDAVGLNTPLVSESITTNGIFEPGEAWVFRIQDFGNLLNTANQFGEIGVPDLTSLNASGNIIASVPEPGTAALLGLGLAVLAIRRRPRG